MGYKRQQARAERHVPGNDAIFYSRAQTLRQERLAKIQRPFGTRRIYYQNVDSDAVHVYVMHNQPVDHKDLLAYLRLRHNPKIRILNEKRHGGRKFVKQNKRAIKMYRRLSKQQSAAVKATS